MYKDDMCLAALRPFDFITLGLLSFFIHSQFAMIRSLPAHKLSYYIKGAKFFTTNLMLMVASTFYSIMVS